jgi:hypothetical protein
MTLKKAREVFEQAQALALDREDEEAELLAIGLQEMVKSLERELRAIRSDLDAVKSEVRRLR